MTEDGDGKGFVESLAAMPSMLRSDRQLPGDVDGPRRWLLDRPIETRILTALRPNADRKSTT
ncbi:MAG TPA: hypothetical protein VJN19_03595 [Propionibacteriaceae bacterium]|nr:hypothetical protein [Propionibacteriaceae bacterium]